MGLEPNSFRDPSTNNEIIYYLREVKGEFLFFSESRKVVSQWLWGRKGLSKELLIVTNFHVVNWALARKWTKRLLQEKVV